MSVARWLEDLRVDFGVMEVLEGKRPRAVLEDVKLQQDAEARLQQLEHELEDGEFVGFCS
ncbi:hypothetical protein GCM10023328_38920 [Modestobacter marinus]|uniref:Uncharacterized protein n=1 Tax=Modestobacter marinus TaxID=477641 RepID=A0ABQ2G5E6_9ACTN|nr:hypothetical protein GCM10011589_35610 [Modestobacter marinus]